MSQRAGDGRWPPTADATPNPQPMPSIKQTLHALRERRRRCRPTLPWAELEAEAARQGCSPADIFFDRAGLAMGDPPTACDAGAAHDPDSASNVRGNPAPGRRKPSYDTWGRRA
jgi:hypothetical protein